MSKSTSTATTSTTKKRSKTTSILQQVLKSGILDDQSTLAIQTEYKKNKPYPYAQIKNLFLPDFLLAVKEEIKSQTKVTFKESDLFRVYQSIDLANLVPGSDVAIQQLPNVMKLREVLYSQEWRTYIEKLCGLQPSTLIDKIDCACNCHAPGCHLLCHDDVIGTRKVSYIIYLTEQDWKEEEGGSLELYGKQKDNDDDDDDEPTIFSPPVPLAHAWPVFNSMAFFVVKPGESYHAVQEVLGQRPRLSLQGWYHAEEPPENIQLATLQQLKKKKNDTTTDTSQEEEEDEKGETTMLFSDDDRKYLSKYIKDEYLSEESMNGIQSRFIKESSVQLRNFLHDKWVPKIGESQKPKSVNSDMEQYYMSGVSDEWKLTGPAHKQRFLQYHYEESSTNDCQVIGSLLHHIQNKVFESPVMARYLQRITSLGQSSNGVKNSTIRRFRPGLDYTVAHYGLLVQESVLDATLCFVCDDTEEDKYAWEGGDVGGFECYIEADDYDDNNDDIDGGVGGVGSGEAADEYNEDDDTELLSVSASNNTLSLVYRDPGTMRFVKYVGSTAPSSRYDITMEYQVLPDDDDDDDDENDNDENETEKD